MLRGNWRHIVAAIAGLAALGSISTVGLYTYGHFYDAAEQQYPREDYQPARDATEPPALVEKEGSAKPYDPHCDQPQNGDDADLCAQWGAVQAVTETNRLTALAIQLAYIGFWIATIGGVIGIVGTAYLVKTFRENRRAADAAHDANRPWLEPIVVKCAPLQIGETTTSMWITVEVHNRGNSPALNAQLFAELVPCSMKTGSLHPGRVMDEVTANFARLPFTADSLGSTVFPGNEWTCDYHATVETEKLIEATQSTTIILMYLGLTVRYRFGDKLGRTSVAHFIETGDWVPPNIGRKDTTATILVSLGKAAPSRAT